MRITVKQEKVLNNLHRVVNSYVGRKPRPLLDGEDCTLQLHSLGAKGLIRRNGRGLYSRVDDPGRLPASLDGRRRSAAPAQPPDAR